MSDRLWQSMSNEELLTGVRAAQLDLADRGDPATLERLARVAEALELAMLRPTTLADLAVHLRRDFALLDRIIRDANRVNPGFTELRVSADQFSPYFPGGPLGDLDTNMRMLLEARGAAGRQLVAIGYAAEDITSA
ncbi:hypothetical protein [Goodfellowiella coeruleoviolacea]|uniref:Uncharacterized protein n=1 Tax=Goodfellowiella coeruleoviolacea TaxID=334858 RepID=A0AAE3KEC7_9PSEU|nr:hypothetical protein [Goodfellowiella coeruleoviolacea]MCP2165201.1 hypothetical protein [Goodfellowiella coeruleoviolacea]